MPPAVRHRRLDDIVRRLQPIQANLQNDIAACNVTTAVSAFDAVDKPHDGLIPATCLLVAAAGSAQQSSWSMRSRDSSWTPWRGDPGGVRPGFSRR